MFSVHLVIAGNLLRASIDGGNEESQCAFYIIKNGDRVATQWYQDSYQFSFEFDKQPGIYSVVGFLKSKDGVISLQNSKSIIYGGDTINVEALGTCELDGPHLVSSRGLKIPIIIDKKEEKFLFVLLSGAIDRKRQIPPVFNRWTWRARFPGTVLCISDPVLEVNSSIELGWYIGNDAVNGAEAIAELIIKIATRLDIPLHRVITYGSSGGGFAALKITETLKIGVAVAINCQVDVLHYHEDAVDTMLNVCFQGASRDDIRAKFNDRISVIEGWRIASGSAHAVLVQNKGDHFHYVHHYKKMASILGLSDDGGASENGRHYSFVYNDQSGHGPEPSDLVDEIISCALNYAG